MIYYTESRPDEDGTVNLATLDIDLSGYMLKSVYDTTDDGMVDDSSRLGGNLPAYYSTDAKADYLQGQITAHEANTGNPHVVSKSQVGLSNVDNTSDQLKPLSIADISILQQKIDIYGDTSEMITSYTPSTAYDIVTKGYVDAAIGSSTTTSVVATQALMLSGVGPTVVGDRCIVTSDATPANNGEYVCNVTDATAPPTLLAAWTQMGATGGGNLTSDGVVPMDGGYAPSAGSQDIATSDYVDTEIAAELVTFKTDYERFTWALPGAVSASTYIVPMLIMIPSGETWYVSRCRHTCASGSGVFEVEDDGTGITGFTAMAITTSVGTQDSTDVAIADSSLLGPDITSASSLTDVTITIEIKKVRT